jgi:hypothetical protein
MKSWDSDRIVKKRQCCRLRAGEQTRGEIQRTLCGSEVFRPTKGITMLRSMQELKNYTIGATDGEIGHVTDFFFDDASWVVRYLVVDTGSWLTSRKVLISPYSLMRPDWMHKRLPVRINRDQVKNSPDIDTDKPVSRQHEMSYADYYGYPYYWGAQDDPHLRSCNAVIGYHLHARDGDIGHVQGMLVDEGTWALRYLVVETSTWWGGHQVLISPNWIESISWAEATVSVNLIRQAVKASPRFDSAAELNRGHEIELYGHYQRATYWEQELGLDMAMNHEKFDT